MKVFIAGIDGYLGWPLALHLAARGHQIAGMDCFLRREWVEELSSHSALPIPSMTERCRIFQNLYGVPLRFDEGDLTNYNAIASSLESFRPEAIVHLGEMPSAPYSMMDRAHCAFTHTNNLVGTLNILYAMKEVCPQAHLVKLGTMGEYGTPNMDIPEGSFEIEYRGRKDTLPFPRQGGSWYHQTKIHDSSNVMFACRVWGLCATDVMQGVVFGTRVEAMGEDERLFTRFDFDQCFGTVINRFCAQAVVGHPITVFGKGHQRRGFLPLRDSVQCLGIAIENPPKAGEYRVFNQFDRVYDLTELAVKVQRVGRSMGMDVQVCGIENPRVEKENHYYRPDHQRLLDLGYRPTLDIDKEIEMMLQDLVRYRDRIERKRDLLLPDIRWDGSKRKSRLLEKVCGR